MGPILHGPLRHGHVNGPSDVPHRWPRHDTRARLSCRDGPIDGPWRPASTTGSERPAVGGRAGERSGSGRSDG